MIMLEEIVSHSWEPITESIRRLARDRIVRDDIAWNRARIDSRIVFDEIVSQSWEPRVEARRLD
jgi:hypothetical protein